jgi:hypothetical protein
VNESINLFCTWLSGIWTLSTDAWTAVAVALLFRSEVYTIEKLVVMKRPNPFLVMFPIVDTQKLLQVLFTQIQSWRFFLLVMFPIVYSSIKYSNHMVVQIWGLHNRKTCGNEETKSLFGYVPHRRYSKVTAGVVYTNPKLKIFPFGYVPHRVQLN